MLRPGLRDPQRTSAPSAAAASVGSSPAGQPHRTHWCSDHADHQAAGQGDQGQAMTPLIGAWRTLGAVFGADGRTVVVSVAGSDVYEELGLAVVQHVDVEIGGSQPSLPVTQAPDDARKRFGLQDRTAGRRWIRRGANRP